jgi:gliding motility associated protien GldN
MKSMKIRNFIILFGVIVSNQIHAQILSPDPLGPEDDGIVKKSNMHHNASNVEHPFRYSHLHEDDILWSERHWERIELKEKINFPLKYPLDSLPDRLSLYQVLYNAIFAEGTIQRTYGDEYFLVSQTPEETQEKLVEYRIETSSNGLTLDTLDIFKITPRRIVSYQIKSDWYFDKKRGELKNRIIAIAPEAIREISGEREPLFWIYFPEARLAMSQAVAFNEKNYKQRLTFDQIMHLRKFSSTIIKVDNVYGRTIEEYNRNRSMNQLLEAARLKEDLRNKEHDMWTY